MGQRLCEVDKGRWADDHTLSVLESLIFFGCFSIASGVQRAIVDLHQYP
jgi:hypothetical protein